MTTFLKKKLYPHDFLRRMIGTFFLTISFLVLASLPLAAAPFPGSQSQNYPIYHFVWGGSIPVNPIRVVGARGEHMLLIFEFPQLIDCSMKSSLIREPGCSLNFQAYLMPPLPGGFWQRKIYDVLVPIEKNSGVRQGSELIAVVLGIPSSQSPGNYRCDLLFRVGGREFRQPIALQVWRFTLPEDLPVTILGDLWPQREWFVRYGVRNDDIFTETIATYLKIMRSYKINAIGNFYPLPTFEVARGRPLSDFPSYLRLVDEAMALGYRYFRLPTLADAKLISNPGNLFERNALGYYTHMGDFLKSRHLMGKALIKIWDEPTPADYPQVARAYGLVKAAAPELKTETAGMAPDQALAPIINIWAVYNVYYDQEKIAAASRRGMEVWLYANILHGVNKPAVCQRLMGWYLYRSGLSGYLFWSVNYWPEDPWTEPPGKKDFYRRGTLFYPHPSTGLPLPTLRLETIRRGWEDYQYLTLFKEAAQQGKVDQATYDRIQGQVMAIAGNLKKDDSNVSWQQIEDLRIQIGEMLNCVAGVSHE